MEERFELFTSLLTNLSRNIHKIKTAEMSEFNLKSSHLSCIYYLYKMKTLTATELCECCDEDKANISRAIKHLEENGYLSCDIQSQKRYQAPLYLTERGIDVGRRISERLRHVVEAVSRGVPEEDRTAMYRALFTICENLQKMCDCQDKKKSAFRWENPLRRLKRSMN